jgi:hypothetical protein
MYIGQLRPPTFWDVINRSDCIETHGLDEKIEAERNGYLCYICTMHGWCNCCRYVGLPSPMPTTQHYTTQPTGTSQPVGIPTQPQQELSRQGMPGPLDRGILPWLTSGGISINVSGLIAIAAVVIIVLLLVK